MLSISRERQRNVKRWRGGEMVLRWTAAGMLNASAASGACVATGSSRSSKPRSELMSNGARERR